MKWALGVSLVIIVVLIILYTREKSTANNYENDLALVAKNYNGLASGAASELKSDQLITLDLGSNGFLSIAGSTAPL